MKKLISFFLIPLIAMILVGYMGFASYNMIEAQEQQENVIKNVISLNLKQLTQDPRTHEFSMLVAVNSQVDSDRVKVTWVAPKNIEIKGDKNVFIKVVPGETSVVQATFLPQRAGKFKIEVTVEIIKADVDYVSSVSQEIGFDGTLMAIPVSPKYSSYQQTYDLRDGFQTASIVLAVLGVISIAAITFIRWLNADDNVKSEV